MSWPTQAPDAPPVVAADHGASFTIDCVHGDRCGGCALLGVPVREQARRKREAVRLAMADYSRLAEIPVAELENATPIIEYRTRAKLVVERGKIGLYERGTHDVVDIPHCRVLSPAVAAVVAGVRGLLRGSPAASAVLGLDVREQLDGEAPGALVTLIGTEAAREKLNALAHEIGKLEAVRGVAISTRDRKSPALLGGVPEVVLGPAFERDRLVPSRPYSLIAHGSFTQAHRGQAAALNSHMLEALRGALSGLRDRRVLELYAGSGGFGLWLAAEGALPFLVERYAPALELVGRAASEQGLPVPETQAADATRAVSELAERSERFDAVIVNPPRHGLPASLRRALGTLAPSAIAYVSCDPRTLARDLDHLAWLGYRAQRFEPFDMMPLSLSVECFALLTRAERPKLQVLYEDEQLLVVNKPPHLATTPEGGNKRSLLGFAQTERALPALAAVHRLDAETSGVCLLAKQRNAVAELGAALAAGEKQYLALVRGITRAKGSIDRPLLEQGRRRDARTRYARSEVLGGHSLLRVRPDQGRTHQVRRHLAGLGHPVLGDGRHGDPSSNRHLDRKHGLDRTFLHLARVTIANPRTGQPLVLEAPLPADLAAVCISLRAANDPETSSR